MKLILSRKGFDSEYGGCASPIFPDDTMVSLPIPWAGAHHRMNEAICRNRTFDIGEVVADLTRRRAPNRRYDASSPVHLDPYLIRSASSAPTDWRPAFGQVGGAQGHLQNEGIGPGDLFLFFGWFRRVEWRNGVWRYIPNSPDLHVLFGWLQIDEVLHVDDGFMLGEDHQWLSDHPHLQGNLGPKNTIYVASKSLSLDGVQNVPGGGAFETFRECLQLTAPGAYGRRDWQLPGCFDPSAGSTRTLSHHRDLWRWRLDGIDGTLTWLQAVDIGQEFVIDLEGPRRVPAAEWLRSIFSAQQGDRERLNRRTTAAKPATPGSQQADEDSHSPTPAARAPTPSVIDLSSCESVESDPERGNGAWLFRGTRVPVAALFENLSDGASVGQFIEWFPEVTAEQVRAVVKHMAFGLSGM